MAHFGVPANLSGEGSPIMQRLLNQLTADAGPCLRAHGADEEQELALLTQFMRHDSVASLANAIAERSGGNMRGGDLIAAAGISSSDSDSWRPKQRDPD
jgi:hypothetical protein